MSETRLTTQLPHHLPPHAEPAAADAVPQLLERLRAPGVVRTQNLKGAARGYALSGLHRGLSTPLICVAVDEEAVEHLASDLAFFLGGKGTAERPNVIVLPGDEVLPYDEVSPDAATVADRLGALFHLAHGTPFAALVLSRRMLARRVLHPAVLRSLSDLVRVGEDHPRDDLARKLDTSDASDSHNVALTNTSDGRSAVMACRAVAVVVASITASPVGDVRVRMQISFFGSMVANAWAALTRL